MSGLGILIVEAMDKGNDDHTVNQIKGQCECF